MNLFACRYTSLRKISLRVFLGGGESFSNCQYYYTHMPYIILWCLVVVCECLIITIGHPIGATGLGQCAEICWQVSYRFNDIKSLIASVAVMHSVIKLLVYVLLNHTHM